MFMTGNNTEQAVCVDDENASFELIYSLLQNAFTMSVCLILFYKFKV